MYRNLVVTLLGMVAVRMHMWLPMLDIVGRNVWISLADDEHFHQAND